MPIDIQTAAPPDTPEGTENALSPQHCPEAKRKAFQKTDDDTKEYIETKDHPVCTSGKKTKEEKSAAPKVEEFTESDHEARYKVIFIQLVRLYFLTC